MIRATSYKIQAKKSLGQNFLINPHILEKIVAAAEITSNETVLEIGPGTGNLTEILSKEAGRVIAIEKDHRLISVLTEKFKNSNVKLVEDDILKLDPRDLEITQDYKIVANIPYYITSNLLRIIFESPNWRATKPSLIVLTIQKEVAQRIIAKPPHTNLLALSVQYYAEPKVISYISKNNFRPVPKVDSAIIRLVPRQITIANEQEEGRLFELMKAGFSEKRKQLAPVLSKKLKIPKEDILNTFEKVGLAPNIRPENLSLAQWQELAKIL